MKVVELKNWAREQRVRGFSKMRKAELQKLYDAFHSGGSIDGESLLDQANPEIDVPFLIPETKKSRKSEISEVVEKTVETFSGWLDWLKDTSAWEEADSLWKKLKRKVNPKLQQLKEKIKGIWKKEEKFKVEESRSALRGFVREFSVRGRAGFSPDDFMREVAPVLMPFFKVRNKIKFVLTCQMSRTDLRTGETVTHLAEFHSRIETILAGTDIGEVYDLMRERVNENIETFQGLGSNWRFDFVESLSLHTVKFKPLKGSSFLKLPSGLKNKKAVVNIKNNDQECFKWAVGRSVFPVERNPQRITKELRLQVKTFDWRGISFPTPLNQINKFERQNLGFGVNVFGVEGGEVYPMRISKVGGKMIDLLLIKEGEDSHYCCINSLSRLLGNQITRHNGMVVFCRRCLNHFPNRESLEKHLESCENFEAVKIVMPEKGEKVKFKNYNRKMKFPFAVYADFESRQEMIQTVMPNPDGSFTEKFQKHIPVSFAFHLVSPFCEREPVVFRAENDDVDVGKVFVEKLEEFIKEIQNEFENPKEMIWGKEEKDQFERAKECWICEGRFEKGEVKVRDHCHFSGKFRGAAHNKCNLMFQKPNFTPVFFHNLTGYDSHLFVKNLGMSQGEVTCLPNNEEKYISFGKKLFMGMRWNGKKDVKVWHEIRFLDSARFMADSLGNLVRNLTDDDFVETKKGFGDKWELLKRKGVFPYEWLDSVEKFKVEKLPEKEAFYSQLNDEGISDSDWEYAVKVWKEFDMKNMGDYHDVYLKADVFQLADVFEAFRKVCQTHYDLDPAWFYTSAALAWEAALKESRVELELLTDPDMLQFFEMGIRGGVSTIFHRHARANNKFMGEKFDKEKPSKFIAYVDANGLYSWAMTKELPLGDFRWMTQKERDRWDEKKEGVGCLLEVDVEIPKELHDEFNDFPPLPERKEKNGVEKLIPNLSDKERLIVHEKALKQALELGCVLKKVWRGVRFKEETWLKSYIMKNAELRMKCKTSFEKNFFKLLNNAVFGKTMENIRKRVNIQLVNSKEKMAKLAAKSSYQHATIFDENLVAVHLRKIRLKFNKPVYVGQAILDISKTLMYDFHYGYARKKWDKCQLCFTDTDSLLYEIETDDFFEDIRPDVDQWFDTADFPKDHHSGIQGKNKKVLGMFKDEGQGGIIEEFVGLRSKLYSYKMFEGKETKKAKGVKKNVIKKNITHEDYLECLKNKEPQMRIMNCIRSEKHELYTQRVNKTALSGNDDKRWIAEDGVKTLAWGHWRIKDEEVKLKRTKMPQKIKEKLDQPITTDYNLENKKCQIERFLKKNKKFEQAVTPGQLERKYKLPWNVIRDEMGLEVKRVGTGYVIDN